MVHLGAHLDFASGMSFLTEEQVSDLLTDANKIVATPQSSTLLWRQLLGRIASLVDLLGLYWLHMSSLQCHFLGHASLSDPDLARMIPLAAESRPSTGGQAWTGSGGRPFCIEAPLASIATDAWQLGWGATWWLQECGPGPRSITSTSSRRRQSREQSVIRERPRPVFLGQEPTLSIFPGEIRLPKLSGTSSVAEVRSRCPV